MNARLSALSAGFAAALGALTLAAPAMAQTPVAAAAVGHWLYDSQGRQVGSVHALADNGATAVVIVGSYFQPGVHEARVPTSALILADGRVTLRPETMQALNILPNG